MKQKLILIICISVFSIRIGLSQNIYDHHTLDSLRNLYALNRYHYLLTYHPKRLPVSKRKIQHPTSSQRCVRSYRIPDSAFLKLSPFNADSIVIMMPDSDANKEEYHYLTTMKKKNEIADLADIVFNYDLPYNNNRKILVVATLCSEPSYIRLYAYKAEKIDTISLFWQQHISGGFYVYSEVDTLSDPAEWACENLGDRISEFFQKHYRYQLKRRREYPPVPKIIPPSDVETKKQINE